MDVVMEWDSVKLDVCVALSDLVAVSSGVPVIVGVRVNDKEADFDVDGDLVKLEVRVPVRDLVAVSSAVPVNVGVGVGVIVMDTDMDEVGEPLHEEVGV